MVAACERIQRELSNYLEGRLSSPRRSALRRHLKACAHCRAVLDGIRNVVQLAGGQRAFPLPPGFEDRLRRRLAEAIQRPAEKVRIPLGIGGEFAAPGDHIAYFWQSEREFEDAVKFLAIGLRQNDACVVFGHEDANLKVLSLLRSQGIDVSRLIEERRLCVLGGHSTPDEMLAEIGGAFQAALAAGAPVLRLLGNIGWGLTGWPGQDRILEFEASVTAAARLFPCVVICMYDVASLPGRVIFKGGFETHPLTLHGEHLDENRHYVSMEDFLAGLQRGADPGVIQ